MNICFPCTSCNKPLLADDTAENTQVECPICHRLVWVPNIQDAVPALKSYVSDLGASIRPASLPPLPQVSNNTFPELAEEKTIMVKLTPEMSTFTPESKSETEQVEEGAVLEVDLEPLPEEEERPVLNWEGELSLREVEGAEPEPVEPVSFEIVPDHPTKSDKPDPDFGGENLSLRLDEPSPIKPPENLLPNLEKTNSTFQSRQELSTQKEDFYFTTVLVEQPLRAESSLAVQVLPDLMLVNEGAITTKPGRVKDLVTEPEEDFGDVYRVEPPPDIALTPAILEREKDLHRLREHLPSKGELRKENQALRITSKGLALVYWSTICFLLGVLIQIGNLILMSVVTGSSLIQGTPPPPGGLWTILMLTGFVFQLLSGLLMVVGKLYCCWVPPRTKARTLIIISFCLDLGSMAQVSLAFVLLNFATVVIPALPASTALVLGLLVYGSALLMILTSFVMFFLFLRAFAYYLEDQGTASEAWDILVTWLALSIGWPLFIGVLIALSGFSFFIMMILIIFVALGSFWWVYLYLRQWIRFLHLIGSLRIVLAAKRGC